MMAWQRAARESKRWVMHSALYRLQLATAERAVLACKAAAAHHAGTLSQLSAALLQWQAVAPMLGYQLRQRATPVADNRVRCLRTMATFDRWRSVARRAADTRWLSSLADSYHLRVFAFRRLVGRCSREWRRCAAELALLARRRLLAAHDFLHRISVAASDGRIDALRSEVGRRHLERRRLADGYAMIRVVAAFGRQHAAARPGTHILARPRGVHAQPRLDFLAWPLLAAR